MKLTQEWIKKQISDYSEMLTHLTDEDSDAKLRTIWSERINTLTSTLGVLELEMRAYERNFYTNEHGILIDKRGE